jgi:DNA-binding NarL/FixJ family response regulator
MTIGILLADDHKLMREGLRTLISEQPDMTVVAEAEDGRSAVQLATRLSPEIVIMDVSMTGLNGVEATRQILAASAATRIIALSMHTEIRIILEMLSAGALGYLLKDCAFDEVIYALKTVSADRAYVSPKIADILFRDYLHRHPGTGPDELPGLTPQERTVLRLITEGRGTKDIAGLLHLSETSAETQRQELIVNHIVPHLHRENSGGKVVLTVSLTGREREILIWVKEGKSTWDIASILGISENTVRFHLKNIFQKLNASSRTQAIAVALENGIIDL